MEAVAEFGVELAGIVVVEAAKGKGVVEQDAMVGDVGCGYGGGDVFGDGLADGEIEDGVVGEVLVWIGSGGVGVAVGEAGAVVDVGGGVGMRGERGVEADIQRVALVVVDGGVVEAGVAGGVADGSADEASGDVATLLRDLVGVSEVGLA